MLIHRALDLFFRTLDTVDAVRDRIDEFRGKTPTPDPWSVDWPPPEAELPTEDEKPAAKKKSSNKPATKEPTAKKKASQKPAAKKKASKKAATKKTAAKKKSTKKKTTSKRKGSVDRSGKDYDSPRATEVLAYLKKTKGTVIREDTELDGKKVLARVIWALCAARDAGVGGMTTADVSALLSHAAEIEVFATNVGRACRDHATLIEVESTEGRSKRYAPTAAGARAGASLAKG